MPRTTRLALVGLAFIIVGTALADGEVYVPRSKPTKQELDRREAQKLYGVGALHEKSNRLVEAIRAFEQAQKLDPASAAIPRSLFGLYLALDRTDDALAAFQKVLKLEPDDCATAYLYSRQLRGLDRKKEAVAALRQAAKSPRIKERPDLAAQVWFDLAVLHEEASEWGLAEKAFREVVALLDNPKGLAENGKYSKEEITAQAAETMERVGKACLKAGRVEDAVKAFEAAKKKDPLRAPRLALHLAQVYRDQNKPREALAQLDIYLAGQPQGTEAYEMKIEAQRKVGRDAEVLPALEHASGRDPNNVQLRLLLARELGKARRGGDARKIYDSLLETHVTAEVYRGLFELHRQRGAAGVEEVIDQLDKAMTGAAGDEEKKQEGDPSEARRARAMLQVLRDDAALVRAVLPAAVGRAGRKRLHYTTRGVLATLAARTRQLEHAEKLYRSCLDKPRGLGSSEAEVYFGLLRVLRLQRKHADTVSLCEQGLRYAQQTNRVLFHTELVHAHLAGGDFKAALAAADLAVAEAGKGSLLMCKRIRVDALVQAGQKDKALAECQAMLKEYNSGSDLRDVRYALSGVYNAMGRPDDSEEQLRLILQADPNDATANNDLGYFWADRNKNLDEAERMIRKAIDLDKLQRNALVSTDADADKENAAYVDSLGWALFRRGKIDEARKELERASTLPHGEDDPVVWDHLGDVYYKQKQADKAVEAWRKSMGLYEQGTRRKSDGRYQEIQGKGAPALGAVRATRGEGMAGHSHWANIQHKKGIVDAKRGKLWSKLSRAIIIAAKHGGGDPGMNLKLRYAIDKARSVSMPRDNIERAIKRGTGEGNTDIFDEIMYEGFGPGGVAILVEVLTDNRNRTGGEVRKLFERGGGNMGAPGCVGYLFDRKGVLTVSAAGVEEDTLMGVALDAGAEDMRREGDVYEIVCDPASFSKVQEAIAAAKVLVTSAELPMLPKASVDAPDVETAMKACRLVELLDDHDDVQNVHSNLNMTDEILAELSK